MAPDEPDVELDEMLDRADKGTLAVVAAGDRDAKGGRKTLAHLDGIDAYPGPGQIRDDPPSPLVVADVADDVCRHAEGAEAEGEIARLTGACEMVTGAGDAVAPLR